MCKCSVVLRASYVPRFCSVILFVILSSAASAKRLINHANSVLLSWFDNNKHLICRQISSFAMYLSNSDKRSSPSIQASKSLPTHITSVGSEFKIGSGNSLYQTLFCFFVFLLLVLLFIYIYLLDFAFCVFNFCLF